MFRQGDIISYTENRNSSDSKGSVSFGIYLNMCRLKRKITLKKLCHGLCSVSYLAEIMHGKKRADWQLRNRLLERTGENGLDHEIYFGYEEAVEWERQRDILIALEDCKIIQAAEKLADYAEEYGIFDGSRSGVTSRLRRQFYYGMQGMCRSLWMEQEFGADQELQKAEEGQELREAGAGREPQESGAGRKLQETGADREPRESGAGQERQEVRKNQEKRNSWSSRGERLFQDMEPAALFGEAVRLTVSGADSDSLHGMALSIKELDLILEYGKCMKNSKRIKIFRNIMNYSLINIINNENLVRIYPKTIWYFCSSRLPQAGKDTVQNLELLKLCNKGIELLRATRGTLYLQELLTLREQVIQKLMYLQQENGENPATKIFSRGLATARESRGALEALGELTGVSVRRRESCFLYQQQNGRYIGDIIRIRRRMLGMTGEELSRGVCSPVTLRRLENRQKSTQLPIVSRLCRRLGLPSEQEGMELASADPKVYELERRIRRLQLDGAFEQSLRLLEEVKERIDISYSINRQCILLWEATAGYETGRLSREEYISCLQQGLEYTLPLSVLQQSKMQECYLTNMEMKYIYRYSLLACGEEVQEARRRLEPVCRTLRGMEKEGSEQNYLRLYGCFAGYEAVLLQKAGEYRMAEQQTVRLMRHYLQMGRAYNITEPWYVYFESCRLRMMNTAPEEAEREWRKGVGHCLAISRFYRDKAGEKFFVDLLENGPEDKSR